MTIDKVKVAMWKAIIEKAATLRAKYDAQQRAGEELNENEFDKLYHSVDFVWPHTIHMGLNTSCSDGEAWTAKLREVREVVEQDGVAEASWGCTGRTLHMTLAHQLEKALPEYEFDIGYESYRCRIFKK